MSGDASKAWTALAIGLALAGAPGPVQAVLLGESIRGGVKRGFRALAGVHGTFGALVVSLALGLSVASPSGLALRFLRIAGGLLLLWLAVDGVRSAGRADADTKAHHTLPPELRGVLSIALNPGGWLFLGAVASPLLTAAAMRGGTSGAVLAGLALVVGAAVGDAAVVLLGGLALRRTRAALVTTVRIALAVVLAGFGLWLLISAAVP